MLLPKLPTTISDYIFTDLREGIINGTLKPNQTLREEEISLRFGSSRGPIRESLRLLLQTGLVVHVVQGERERVEDCRSLAQFELTGIPPMVAGAARIEVAFRVDADGILEVGAVEQHTGASSEVTVKPAFGLDESQITEMLKASYEHANEDMLARKLGEARLEGEALVAGLQAAIAKDGDLLSAEEVSELEAGIFNLQTVLSDDEPEQIRASTEILGQASEAFAAMRMDRSIQAALQGVSITDLDGDEA